MSERETIHIQQALHGYRDGHRLLTSSTSVAPIDARTMLVLSDLSGSNVPRGFQQYLTGYPLPACGSYVLARTWYAEEMSRPGCVWTHSLIISRDSIARLESPQVLLSRHRRPGTQSETEFAAEIAVASPSGPIDEVDRGPRPPLDVVTELLFALYRDGESAVLLPAASAKEFESLVLSLWFQQWPDLRACFSFCTGVADVRMIGERPLDLQIAPFRVVDHICHRYPSIHIIGRSAPESSTDHEKSSALLVAAHDLGVRRDSVYRSFLARFGQAVGGKRKYFLPLSDLYYISQPHDGGAPRADEFVQILVEHFPEVSDAPGLKVALLGPPTSRSADTDDLSDVEIVRAVASLGFPKGLRIGDMSWESRVQEFARANPETAVSMCHELMARHQDEFICRIVDHVLDSLCDADVVASWSYEAIAQFAEMCPRAARLPALWHGSTWHQRELFRRVEASLADDVELIRAAVVAMLTAGSDAVVDLLALRDAAVIVRAVLDWIDRQAAHEIVLPYGWRRLLENEQAVALEWLASHSKPAAHGLWAVLSAVDLLDESVPRRGAAMWLPVIGQDWTFLPPREHRHLMVCCTVIGLTHQCIAAARVLAFGFEATHEMLARDTASWDDTRLLDRVLPDLGWLRNWDRCERLRRALVEAVIRNEWPADTIRSCCPSSDLLHEVLRSGRGVKGIKKLRSELTP